MDPQIIKEEKDYIVINKPAGLIVHSDGRTQEKNLCDFMIGLYPEIKGVGEPLKIITKTKEDGKEIIKEKTINRPGIVHRLDRETSGVMIIARTEKGFDFFKELFKNRKVEKKYHTFVYGNIREDIFSIDEPIGRSKKNFKQWMSGENTRGKLRSAKTDFKILKRSEDKSVTFVEALPKTGRTHQIRVHLKSINAPIISDNIYAPNREQKLGFDRLALHSYSIGFTDIYNNKVSFSAGYPEDFDKAVERFS